MPTIGGMNQDDEAYFLSQIPKPRGTRINASKISTVLNRVIEQKGYAAIQSRELLGQAWEQAVGPHLAPQTRVGKVERGALQVFTSSKIVLTELEFMKPQLLKSIQKSLPDFSIRSLKFRCDGHR